MVSRVAVGEAAGEGVLQEGSLGGRQDEISGTTVATPGGQINLNRSISKGFKPSSLPFFE